MARPRPVRMLCTYRVKRGREVAFLRLLGRHWPALRRAGLATSEPARVLRCRPKRGGAAFFVETFSWTGAGASAAAHESPEVLAVWGPMEGLLDGMDLAEVEAVPMPFGKVRGPPTRPAPPRRRRSRRRRPSGGRGSR